MYHDPFVALGVIGEMFDQERLYAGSRKTRCVLGNRMIPLFRDDRIDDVGYNYHFWAYLNISLTGDATFSDVFMNWWLERRVGDSGDSSANTFGIHIGKAIYSKLLPN